MKLICFLLDHNWTDFITLINLKKENTFLKRTCLRCGKEDYQIPNETKSEYWPITRNKSWS
jgi:hypothetical protein